MNHAAGAKPPHAPRGDASPARRPATETGALYSNMGRVAWPTGVTKTPYFCPTRRRGRDRRPQGVFSAIRPEFGAPRRLSPRAGGSRGRRFGLARRQKPPQIWLYPVDAGKSVKAGRVAWPSGKGTSAMASVIVTHGVGDMDVWLKGGADREKLFAPFCTSYRIYRLGNSNRVAIVSEGVDLEKMQAAMSSPKLQPGCRRTPSCSRSMSMSRSPGANRSLGRESRTAPRSVCRVTTAPPNWRGELRRRPFRRQGKGRSRSTRDRRIEIWLLRTSVQTYSCRESVRSG